MGHEHVNNVALRNARSARLTQSPLCQRLLEHSPGAERSGAACRSHALTIWPHRAKLHHELPRGEKNQGTTLAICPRLENVHYVHMLRQIRTSRTVWRWSVGPTSHSTVNSAAHRYAAVPHRSRRSARWRYLNQVRSSPVLTVHTHIRTPPLTVYYSCVGSFKTRSCCSISAASARRGHRMWLNNVKNFGAVNSKHRLLEHLICVSSWETA